MISLYSSTLILFIWQCHVYANQMSGSRSFNGNVAFTVNNSQNKSLSAGGAVSGGAVAGGAAGGAGGAVRNDTGEINMIQNAVNDYERQVSGTNKNRRPKMVGTDTNGNKVICENAKIGVDGSGSPQEALNLKKQICLQQEKRRKDLADSMIENSNGAKECAIKVSKRSLICHTKKVIQNMVEKEEYEIKLYNNVVTLLKAHEPILATVVESLNYNVIKEDVPKTEKLQKPIAQFKFNELGGLLSQEGEMPVAKSDNPCAVCMQELTKKANTMEGAVDDCNYSCDSNTLTAFLKPGHFIEVKSEKDKEEADTEHGEADENQDLE